jgi:hypothetical protein
MGELDMLDIIVQEEKDTFMYKKPEKRSGGERRKEDRRKEERRKEKRRKEKHRKE